MVARYSQQTTHMVEWFKALPKTVFVTLVLATGVFIIVILDPPLSVCDTQVKAFDEKTQDFLKVDLIKKPNRKQSRYAKLIDTCKVTNTAGGCYELFLSMKQLLKETALVSPECTTQLSSHTELNEALWQSVDLMARLAWGEKPPAMFTLKAGWFDPADLNLFCEMRRTAISISGEKNWNTYVETYFEKLPGAKTLERTEAWQRMLFSINCASYL